MKIYEKVVNETNEVIYIFWGYSVPEEALTFQIIVWTLSIVGCVYWAKFIIYELFFIDREISFFLAILYFMIMAWLTFCLFSAPYKIGMWLKLSHEGSVGFSVAIWSLVIGYVWYKTSAANSRK